MLAGLLLTLVLKACTHGPDPAAKGLQVVWSRPDWPPATLPAPSGFHLTPAQAYEAAARSGRLSTKHAWVCYRDETAYYIADTFAQSVNAANVRRLGLRVDGENGEVTSESAPLSQNK